MSLKRISIGKWLNNNKFVAVLSVLLAVVIWLVVAMQMSNQVQATFSDVPVTFDTTMTDKLDLKMFGQTDLRVSVTVSGKRYEVSSAALSSNDFVVTASAANVSSVGKYTLPITVRPKDSNTDVQIVSFTPESIDIYFDYSWTEIYPVEVQISAPNDQIAADGLVEDELAVSTPEVTISGAAAEVQKIAHVIAKVTLDAPLSETKMFEGTTLAIVNENGGIVRSTYVSVADNIKDVTVTIPILKKKQLRPNFKLKNTPTSFADKLFYSWTPPGLINAGVKPDLAETTESLYLGEIDFSQVKGGDNTFSFACDNIDNIRVLDDIDSIEVSFSIDGVQSRTFTLSTENAAFSAAPKADVRASIPEKTFDVTVYGHADELASLTAENFTITVSGDTLTSDSDETELPAVISVTDTTSCWVYGNYTVPVVVS